MSGHKSTISLLLVLGMLFSATQLILAQTRAIQPVRIEATTAQEESISYIYEESHALVIGVSNYSNGWSKLAGVKEDVIEVQWALEENGFEVQLLEDPNKQQLEATIEDFIFEKGANPENRLLIYYAGHGHTKTLGYGGEMGYLVPADAPLPQKGRDIAFQRSVMSMQEIEVFAKNTSAKHVLFMFEACFAGSVFQATRAAPSYIEVFTQEPVRQFITSGSADQEVPDNSIFRRAFVDALAGSADFDKDGYLTGSELGTYIQKRTAEDWKGELTPQYGKLQDPNLNKGDFVFKIGKSDNQSSTASTATANSNLAAQAWEVVKDSTNPKILEEYIRMFPTAPQRNLAKLKLMTLESPFPVQSTDNQEDIVALAGDAAIQQVLKNKDCIGCNLKGAYLWKAELQGANLSGADLTGAYLRGANLVGVNFKNAKLNGADLMGADTQNALFCNTTMPDGSKIKGSCETNNKATPESEKKVVLGGEAAKKKLLETKKCIGCDLRRSDLRKVHLYQANLADADLSQSDLSGSIFYASNFSGANLTQANLEEASLRDSDLSNANLSNAELTLAKFQGTILRKTNLTGAQLFKARLDVADLRGAILENTNLSEITLNGADLREANLRGAILKDHWTDYAKFCNTTMPNGSINNDDC
jgi:uncharacterized protein YjbI with pentapeptide repeats